MPIIHNLSIAQLSVTRIGAALNGWEISNGIATSPVSHSFPRLLLVYGHRVWCNMEVLYSEVASCKHQILLNV